VADPSPTTHKATWLSLPGETIKAGIDHAGWTLREFAERMGFTEKHINQLLAAKAPISTDTAQRLSRVLGGTESFWLEREAQYRQELARREEETTLASWMDWLEDLPRTYLRKYNFIRTKRKGADEVKECLEFYGVASPDSWRARNKTLQASFRASATERVSDGSITTWLRVGEIKASEIDCADFSKQEFSVRIPELRSLTRLKSPAKFLPEMKRICAEAGVAVVAFPSPTGCPAYGVTRWLTPSKALLMLSNRYKTDDQWWFSFFHECGHILLHPKKETFIDLAKKGSKDQKEIEADQFAADTLIPKGLANSLKRNPPTKSAVQQFAREAGISEGIVVGRLQHEKRLGYNRLNNLKFRFDWA